MQHNQDEQIMTELKEIIDDKYFLHALDLYSQLEDQSSEKSVMLKKEIYELFFEETKKFIDHKLKDHLKKYVKKGLISAFMKFE